LFYEESAYIKMLSSLREQQEIIGGDGGKAKIQEKSVE